MSYKVNLEKLLSCFEQFRIIIEGVYISDQDVELEIYPTDSMYPFSQRNKIVQVMSKMYNDLDFDWMEPHLLRISHHDFDDLEFV